MVNYTEKHIIEIVSASLRRLGWKPVEGISPGALRPDLLVSDGKGDLLCLEFKTGGQPIHSKTLSELMRMQRDLANSWPGRITVALVTTAPISERLAAAFLTSEIAVLKVSNLSQASDQVEKLASSLASDTGVGQGDTARMMHSAALAVERGEWNEAEMLYSQLARRQSEILGDSHPYVLEAKYRLASLLARSDRVEEAREMYEALLNEQSISLGARAPSTLATRYNLAGLLGQLGELPRAREMYIELLQDQNAVLGPRHPSTLATRYNLAGLLHQIGELPRAREMYETLLRDQNEVLGPTHPHTLTARYNLAGLFGQIGDVKRARLMYSDLLRDQIEVLGPGHHMTQATERMLDNIT